MLASFVRFTDDATGLEKALRFFQGVSTIIIGLTASAEAAAPWIQARSQLNLGRRYFRLLKWHSCWDIAYQCSNHDQPALPKLLEVAKWSFLGLYYFTEMPTITNVMRVTDYAWAPALQNEANKMWFYAIFFSILLSLYQLAVLASSATRSSRSRKTQDEKSSEKEVVEQVDKSAVFWNIAVQLTIDCCDILIPGSSVGWIPVHEVAVGAAQATSSALATPSIWRRVQPTV